MRKSFCTTFCTTALLLSVGFVSPTAHAADFLFSGTTDSGPLPSLAFGGSFSYDDSNAPTDGEALLSAFSLIFIDQSYTLASAVGQPSAVFAGGSFIGLSYLDNASPDAGVRPHVAFVPGAFDVEDAFFAYEIAGPLGGFGSYAVSPVPEPAAAGLLLAGLAGLAVAGTRSRRPSH